VLWCQSAMFVITFLYFLLRICYCIPLLFVMLLVIFPYITWRNELWRMNRKYYSSLSSHYSWEAMSLASNSATLSNHLSLCHYTPGENHRELPEPNGKGLRHEPSTSDSEGEMHGQLQPLQLLFSRQLPPISVMLDQITMSNTNFFLILEPNTPVQIPKKFTNMSKVHHKPYWSKPTVSIR